MLQFSLSPGAIFSQYGDLSAWSDANNVHAYVRYGAPPYYGLQNEVDAAIQYMPDLPTEITETGEPTLLGNENGVNETVQAVWDLDTLLEAFSIGVGKTFLYSLADPVVAGPPSTSLDDHYGLFHSDGTPKQAAAAVHNLTTILQDSGADSASFTPAALAYSVTGLPYYGFQFLMQKSDGTSRSRALVRTSVLELGDQDGEGGLRLTGFGLLRAELRRHQRLRRDAGAGADRLL